MARRQWLLDDSKNHLDYYEGDGVTFSPSGLREKKQFMHVALPRLESPTRGLVAALEVRD